MKKVFCSISKPLGLAFMLLLTALPAAALSTSHYKDGSALASGRWVKVQVDTTGVYQLTYDQLSALGFDRPEQVYVYGTGAIGAAEHEYNETSPDDLPFAPCIHTGSKLVFYAEGDTRAIPTSENTVQFTRAYADSQSFYFLGCSDAAPEIFASHTLENKTDGASLAKSLAVSVIENERVLVGDGGAHFFDDNIPAGQTRDYVLDIEDMCENSDGSRTGYFGFNFVADAQATVLSVFPAEWNLTNVVHSKATTPGSNSLVSLAFSHVNFTGDNTDPWLTVGLKSPATFSGDYCAPDNVYVVFTRRNRLGDHPWRVLNFNSAPSNSPFSVAEVPADVEIWNVSKPVAPVRLETEITDGTALTSFSSAASSSSPGRYLVFSPSTEFPSPEVVGTVENQNLHADKSVPQMLIVSTASLLPAARQLAEIHGELRGMDVKVVCQDLIFNEFSSGSRLPQGIRRYIKMLYDHDVDNRFKYVLLYGAPSNDNRFINLPAGDYLPTYQNETRTQCLGNTTNYAADAYFGMVADGIKHTQVYKTPAKVTIGRLPIRLLSEAWGANAKIRNFIENPIPAPVALRYYFISDYGNDDKHYMHTESARWILKERTTPMVTSFMSHLTCVGSDNDVLNSGRNDIRNAFMDGRAVMWYAGHSAPINTTSCTAWRSTEVNNTHNTIFPFGFFATCTINGFDAFPYNMGEMMVLKPNGGMIGFISSGREVYMQYNLQLNNEMANQLALARPGDTMADILRAARNENIKTVEAASCYNTMAYNYTGDPSLPLPLFGNEIVVDPFVSNNTLKISAVVTDDEGGKAPFNGIGTVQVYKPVRTVTYQGSKAATEETFTYEDELLAEYPMSFKDGEASGSFPLPTVHETSDEYRLAVTLRDLATGNLAAAMREVQLEAADADSEVPAAYFDQVYFNSPEYTDGANLGSDNVFHALICVPGFPIETRASSIDASPRCIIDGNINITGSLMSYFEPDGRLHISIALPLLAVGPHAIEFSVSDTEGTRIERTLAFNIVDPEIDAEFTVADPEAVKRTDVQFNLDAFDSNAQVNALIIVDDSGNSVRIIAAPSFPYEWNLRDDDGNLVADGTYHAYLRMQRDNHHAATPKRTFVVIK